MKPDVTANRSAGEGLASVHSLGRVLDICWENNPRMHSVFVYRNSWDWKAWVCKGTYGYGDTLFVISFNRVVNGCPTVGTEVESNLASFVSNSNVLV